MASNQSIIINFAFPTNSDGVAYDPNDPSDPNKPDDDDDGSGGSDKYSSDWLKLSQEPYDDKPMSGFNNWLTENGFGLSIDNLPEQMEKYGSQCEEDTGDLRVTIKVQKSRSNLGYTIKASYGILSQASIATGTVDESISVDGEDSADLGMIVKAGTTAEWEGDVVDSGGNFISPQPSITISNNVASFGEEVTGTFRLSGGTVFDEYVLTITPRIEYTYDESKPETAYQSTIAATWGGGVETLIVTMPDMSGNCLEAVWGGSLEVDSDEDGDDEKCYRVTEVRNPCTGKLINTRKEQIKCPTQEEIEAAEVAMDG